MQFISAVCVSVCVRVCFDCDGWDRPVGPSIHSLVNFSSAPPESSGSPAGLLCFDMPRLHEPIYNHKAAVKKNQSCLM